MLKIEIMKIKAFVIENDGNYVIYSEGKGGAIVSDKIREVAKRKFEEAMRLAYAVRTLISYSETNIFSKTPSLNIVYENKL